MGYVTHYPDVYLYVIVSKHIHTCCLCIHVQYEHTHLHTTEQVLLVKEGLYGVQEHVHWCLDKLSAPHPPTAGQVIPEV